ncbi:MAG: tRNA uridine-5-carboxymethylaminomethyl(34) synthesis GTPase MnmE, partial [Clostridia bacterium]|nr:tRNA uridine-5-carboxymethylaminomethyl(34) synthesis GTPase MnmE [Clostridia bacterium]
VRVSGDGAIEVAKNIFSKKGDYIPNMLYAGEIDCGTFHDFGMCVYFRAPKSFTGEDVVEFHCHGGNEIARGVLERTYALGARPAERGEFTKRAFLNGKLSLSAAEGMVDMINAESEAEVRAGYTLYGEKLTKEGKRLSALLLECLAKIDADLDYPEEDLSAATGEETLSRLYAVDDALKSLLLQYRAGKKLKSGVSVVLCGAPNAGKSTLFNALLGYDRAIVSQIAGTTRDIVEGTIEINGVNFRIYDTAGLHESEDIVERDGISRAEKAIQSADLVLWLKEASPVEFSAGSTVITVGAKSDIKREEGCDIYVSAETGEGMDGLRSLIYERGFGRENDGVYLLEERHYNALSEAKRGVEAAIATIEKGLPAELYAEDITLALNALGQVSGESASEAVIDEIFEKFCVGK